VEVYRAKDSDRRYLKYEKSFLHSTAIIAAEEDKIKAVLEYEIKSLKYAELVNFQIIENCDESLAFKKLIEEIIYWNPYLSKIIYNDEKYKIREEILKDGGFIKNKNWTKIIDNGIEVFKVNIKDIKPEQLAVDKVKLERVNSWISCPEDVVVTCINIDDRIVSIDGHSRLVSAFLKGFSYVYGYYEIDNVDLKFFKTCINWCEQKGIFSVEDLTKRVVSPKEHEEIWIKRCREYFKDKKK